YRVVSERMLLPQRDVNGTVRLSANELRTHVLDALDQVLQSLSTRSQFIRDSFVATGLSYPRNPNQLNVFVDGARVLPLPPPHRLHEDIKVLTPQQVVAPASVASKPKIRHTKAQLLALIESVP